METKQTRGPEATGKFLGFYFPSRAVSSRWFWAEEQSVGHWLHHQVHNLGIILKLHTASVQLIIYAASVQLAA